MKNPLVLFTVLACSAGFSHAAGNAEAGKTKAAQVCAACHGPDGNKPSAADQPVLAGQHYDYLVKSLRGFRGNTRADLDGMMSEASQPLSDKDIADVAAWLSAR